MSKLLLFSLLAFSTAAFTQAASPAVTHSPNQSVATAANPFSGMPPGLNPYDDNQTTVSERDRLCLRIHAFIFKTDDDRVPQLVRETTCMPATGGAKKADFTGQPKLMPADGGNRF
jgi:hypothetical protein